MVPVRPEELRTLYEGSMTEEQIAKLAAWKLTGELSCINCLFLYAHVDKWNSANCALKRLPDNPNYDALKTGRCEYYLESESTVLYLDDFGNVVNHTEFTSDELQKIKAAYRESHD